ncbi:MAG: hypothetical protein GSR79_05085 [Desulfurococcales archaeon]|nr:hypothetical protein [Desulfurococcales archaeon]
MKKLEKGKESAIIGGVTDNYRGKVVLKTEIGGKRSLEPREVILSREFVKRYTTLIHGENRLHKS